MIKVNRGHSPRGGSNGAAHLLRLTPGSEAQELDLAVKGRALHPDEIGSARNIAAEARKLGSKIVAFEGFGRPLRNPIRLDRSEARLVQVRGI